MQPSSVLTSVPYVLICGNTYPLVHQVQLKMKRHFTSTVLMLVKPFATSLGLLKICDSLRSDGPMHALLHVDEVLNVCYEL